MGANTNNVINIDINRIKKKLQSPRLKLKDKGIIFEMKNDKIAIVSVGLKIYETRSYQIIQKIENDNEIIEKILELDNNDLIMSCKTGNIYKIKIYRLNNGKYELFQTIDDDGNGYEEKVKRTLNITVRYRRISYVLNNIIKLSENKFITISDLGFKIYSLSNTDDANSKYTLYFMHKNESHDRIKYIYPINENELIIIYFTKNYSLNFFIPGNNYFDIEKYDIKANKMMKKIYHVKKTNIIGSISFSNFIVIKNKYLIILILGKINIFDIIKGEKKLVFSISGNKDNYEYNGNLYNWESISDDIFLLIQDEQFFFFNMMSQGIS